MRQSRPATDRRPSRSPSPKIRKRPRVQEKTASIGQVRRNVASGGQEMFPESIFSDPTYYNEQAMRRLPEELYRKHGAFFDQLEEIVERCRFSTYPAAMEKLLREGHKRNIRIPLDLNPMAFRERVTFVDYMNVFPDFMRHLTTKDSRKTPDIVIRETAFNDKIDSLQLPEYQAAFMRYVYARQHLSAPPSSEDVVVIVCQGQNKCGKLSFYENTFLNGVRILIVEVPCFDRVSQLQKTTKMSERACHIVHGNNEVDDYFLVFFIVYFLRFRKRLEEAITILSGLEQTTEVRSTIDEYTKILFNQKLSIVSFDEYRWATDQKYAASRFPGAWKYGFTMGVSSSGKGKATTTRTRRR